MHWYFIGIGILNKGGDQGRTPTQSLLVIVSLRASEELPTWKMKNAHDQISYPIADRTRGGQWGHGTPKIFENSL